MSLLLLLTCITLVAPCEKTSAEEGDQAWQDGLRHANEVYYINLDAIGEQHNTRVQGFAATYAAAITVSMAKFGLAVSAAQATLNAEEVVCCGLTAPPLVAACKVAAQEVYWAAYSAASWQLGVELTIASTAYYSACEISQQLALTQWEQQDDLWFLNAEACNPPPGVLPERSWVVAGEEPMPPQYVEEFL